MSTALYGRVSSDRQEEEETIQSQRAELQVRAGEDSLTEWTEFLDEGYSRDNLVRPSLDRLRDLTAQGVITRIYIQTPDRLASGAKLVLLVEEFQAQGVEVIFLKGAVEDTPEGKLLLHMQGAIAEYERTKIAERTRRGKLYWARQGAIVGGHAPYGYRFVRRTDTERARFELDEGEAAVVRELYHWLVEEQLSMRAIAGRLTGRGTPTRQGALQWQPTAVDRILRNPTYAGTAYYQRTEAVEPGRRVATSIYRKRRKTGKRTRPESDWIAIRVPPIVAQALWEAAQRQLVENAQHARRNTHHEYLLSGLVRCSRCGGAYYAFTQHGSRGYRCLRAHAANSSSGQRCAPGAFRAQPLEDAVWETVTEALLQPQWLAEEYQRRVAAATSPDGQQLERTQIALALKRLKSQEDRLTDAYLNEAMALDRYKMEMTKLQERRRDLERAAIGLDQRERQTQDSENALEHLQRFCEQLARGVESMAFAEKQQLLRLVVEGVRVEDNRVYVETIIPLDSGILRARHGEPVEP